MRQDEFKFEQACRLWARRNGWVCCKLEKNGCKGIPDDLFISPNQECHLVEFKKDERQKARTEQTVWLSRFSKIAHLIGSPEEFCGALNLPPMPDF